MITQSSTGQEFAEAFNSRPLYFPLQGERNSNITSGSVMAFGNGNDGANHGPLVGIDSQVEILAISSETTATSNSTFEILKNGIGTGVTATISSGTKKKVITGLSLSFTAGDVFNIQCTGGSGGTAWTGIAYFNYNI